MKFPIIILTSLAMVACGGGSSSGDSGKGPEVIDTNHQPIIELVDSQTLSSGEALKLSPKVSDPDGDAITYNWGTDDDTVSIENPLSISPTIVFPQSDTNKTYSIKLTATDSKGKSSSKVVKVLVQAFVQINKSPVINLISEKSVQSGEGIVFTPTVSDPENDPLTYAWSSDNTDVQFAQPNALLSSIIFPQITTQQTMVVTLTVSDSHNNVSTHDVTITLVPKSSVPSTQAPIVTIINAASGTAGTTVTIKAEVITSQTPNKAVWTFNNNNFEETDFTRLSDSRYEISFETLLPSVSRFTNLPLTLTVTTDELLSNSADTLVFVSPNVAPELKVVLAEEIVIDENQTKIVTPTVTHSHKIDSYQWRWKGDTTIGLENDSLESVTLKAPKVDNDIQATLVLTVKMGDETKIIESLIKVKDDTTPLPISLSQSRLVAAQGHDVEIDVITEEPSQIVSANWVIQGFDNVTMQKSTTKLTFTVPNIISSSIMSVLYTAVLKDGSTVVKVVNVSVMNEGAVRAALTVTPPQVTPEIKNNVLYNMPILVVDSLKLIDSIAVTQPFTVNTFEPIIIKKTAYFVQLPLNTNTILFDHMDNINLQIRVGDLVLDYPLTLSMKAD